jgi:aconitate hydratase
LRLDCRVKPHIKTSLAPGSRIVTEYLTQAGLMPYLEKLGFALAGYGCTTCIGNSGDLTTEINEAISQERPDLRRRPVGQSQLRGPHPSQHQGNFLASPPLVVAYAIAGTVLRDLMTEPVGKGHGGKDVWLGDIWPTSDEIYKLMKFAMNGKAFRDNYAKVKTEPGVLWQDIHGVSGETYTWPKSTYIAEPPFFQDFLAGAGCATAKCRCAAPASWRCSATRSPPITSRRPARSRKARRPGSGCSPTE